MPRKLKVFRSDAGFYDAYVAAPSMKAALAAWGSDKNLFAIGAAEEVKDPALTKEPLAKPGHIIRRLRHMPASKGKAPKTKPECERSAPPPPVEKSPPRPDRRPVTVAEAALAQLKKQHEVEMKAVREREEILAKERRRLEGRQEGQRRKLEQALSKAKARYERAIARWNDG